MKREQKPLNLKSLTLKNLKSARVSVKEETVYDITVEDNHNYIISVGGNYYLSHNCLEFIVDEIFGPIVATSTTLSLVPEIQIIPTNITIKDHYITANIKTAIFQHPEKNKILLDHIFRDLKEHECIIVPSERVQHIVNFTQEINLAAYDRDICKINENIAFEFRGDMTSNQKKEVLDKVDKRQCKVLVASTSMIKQGIDLKVPTMIYVISPMSAKQGVGDPMFYQLSNRVCTPFAGKRQPVVKIFLDNNNFARNCFNNLLKYEIAPNTKPNVNNGFQIRYKVSDEMKEIMKEEVKKRQPPKFKKTF